MRIVLGIGQRLLLSSLAQLLERQRDITVVGSTTSGDDGIRSLSRDAFDAVLLDLDLPGPPIDTVIRYLRHVAPHARIVVLAADESSVVHRLRDTPPDGIVTTGASPNTLVSELRATGRAWPPTDRPRWARNSPLSNRQCQVLQLVSDGWSNGEIGTLLSISPGTVKRHISDIFVALNAHSRIEAVNKGAASGALFRPQPTPMTP